MPERKYLCPALSDRKVWEHCCQLTRMLGAKQLHVETAGMVFHGPTQPVESPENPVLKKIVEQDLQILQSMHFAHAGLKIKFSRENPHSSPFFNQLLVDDGGNYEPGQGETRLKVIAELLDRFGVSTPDAYQSAVPMNEQSQVQALHQQQLQRMEQLAEDLSRTLIEKHEALDKRLADKEQVLESAHETKAQELLEEFEQRNLELSERERQLKAERDELDLQGNTAARRRDRKDLLDEIKNRFTRFGVTKNTSKKRWPVIGAMALLTFFFMSMTIWTAWEISVVDALIPDQEKVAAATTRVATSIEDRTYSYWLLGRLALYSLGAAFSVLYFIRWQIRWSDEHSSGEFQLQQFELDMSRASWVIESCLEWRKETKSAIPTELLQAMCRNLFTDPAKQSKPVLHPADELASAILGSAASAKLKVGDNEVLLEKPGKIKSRESKASE